MIPAAEHARKLGDLQRNRAVEGDCATRSVATVFVIDDDISIRESLEALLREAGWRSEMFASASEFLTRGRVRTPSCLILDVSLPDLNGLDLQARIAVDQTYLPIIFITGHGDVPMTVQAMKAGAFEFLTKPFAEDVLLNAIRRALDRSQAALSEEEAFTSLRERYNLLTPRERKVMELVVCGRLNKQVASELAISVITVKAHRGNLMRKMAAESFADLVKMDANLRRPASHGR